jgi:hypothetical protein
LPDAPPPTYTAASLLAAAARSRRRRRVAVVGASLLAVAALAASTVTAVDLVGRQRHAAPAAVPVRPVGPAWYDLDPSADCGVASESVTATPADIADEYRGYATPYPTLPPEIVVARLSCYLMSVVPTYLPGTAFYWNPWRTTEVNYTLPTPRPLEAALDNPAGSSGDLNTASFSAGAIVADANGVGTIEFQVGPAVSSPAEMADNCRAHAGRCELRTGPHGETVGVWASQDADGSWLIDVDVHLGHTVVMAVATNNDPSAFAIPGGAQNAIGRGSPPLTADQLIAILATAQLDLFA